MSNKLAAGIKEIFQQGTVIPAHPLALNEDLSLNETKQRLLTRYYLASGAGGVAVGVHTTQFEIRKPGINLLEDVLRMAAEEIDKASLSQPFIKVAGICGPAAQAVKEAELAVKYGYHLGLVSLGGLSAHPETELIKHVEAVSKIIPVLGFYLQPAVGGRVLSYDFWRAFAEIPNVKGIKVAAFNRYETLDVVRAVCDSFRRDEIALYTGNDDNIVADLLTPYRFTVNNEIVEKRFVGGLLGHWAVWTTKAVELFREIKNCIAKDYAGVEKLLAKGIQVTDMNAVIFDAGNSFKGCIAGIHEVLRRQGLMEGIWCLNKEEKLSAGQMEEIDRVYKMYGVFTDDAFVRSFISEDEKMLSTSQLTEKVKINRRILSGFVFAIIFLSFKNYEQSAITEFKISGFAQGTTYHITYYAADSLVVKNQVDSILDNIDSSLSIYKSYSLISQFNNTDIGVEMDEHLQSVVNHSLEIFKATQGISDITVYPLMDLWGFGPRHSAASPDSAAIQSLMPCIGAGKIHVRGNRLVKDIPCVKIDVNGIAQGYTVDVIADFLEKNGIQNYIVEIGGELRIKGQKQPGNQPIKIGIESPAANSFEEPVIKTIIQLDHGAITTSGNYRKYIERGGKVYSHLMDPKTGYPFQNELISVTVYTNDAVIADGYDNALMGMGLKNAFLFLKKHTGMEAYFIYHNPSGEVSDTATAGFYKMIQN